MRYGIVRDKLRGETVAPNFKPVWNKVDTNMSFGELNNYFVRTKEIIN